MTQIAVRLGSGGPAATRARAVWRLDQAMGGGKSHGLIGLWHLAAHMATALRRPIWGWRCSVTIERVVGPGTVAGDLGGPRCVVLDCDNPEPREEGRRPGDNLGGAFPVAAL